MRYSKIIEAMIEYFEGDVKRVNHALKVHEFAQIISDNQKITAEKSEIINLVSILHDIGIKEAESKYASSSGKYQEELGPPIAREILSKYDIDGDIIDRVCFIVATIILMIKLTELTFRF